MANPSELEREEQQKPALHLYYDHESHFIAESILDAENLRREWFNTGDIERFGGKLEEFEDFMQCDDDKSLTVIFEDFEDIPVAVRSARSTFHKGVYKVTLLAREWCALVGRGYLCSENY